MDEQRLLFVLECERKCVSESQARAFGCVYDNKPICLKRTARLEAAAHIRRLNQIIAEMREEIDELERKVLK